jgi:hypothetical protein
VTEVLTLRGTAILYLPFMVNTQRLGTIRCADVYQGVAIRDCATT